MAKAACSESDFIEIFTAKGASGTARELGISVRSVHHRRKAIEGRVGRPLDSPILSGGIPATRNQYEGRIAVECWDGYVIVFSDAHYWPNIVTTAHRGLVHLAKKLQPRIIIANGDVFDGATASRHPSIGWESRPTIRQEMDACKDRLHEVKMAAPKADHIWTLGNHDMRFEMRLAASAPEFANVDGVHLRDHFPDWRPAWSCWVNEDVVVKHRIKNGIHATHNNTVNAGKTTVTGHLHSLKVTPFDDYNGTRWGVDTGTLADCFGPQFQNYTEDNPRNWRSGFVVLRFIGGKLMWPEAVPVVDETHIYFHGELVEV